MHFQFEQVIALPRSTVFAFHEDPEHLVLLHRGWSVFRLMHHDGQLYQGSRTWFEATIAGILPVVMGFEHTIYEPPHRFGEELIHGPFRKFTHIHEFEEMNAQTENAQGEANAQTENAQTKVRDLLEVELPWHYGGEWAMKMLVAPMLRRAFKCRGAVLLELAQTGGISGISQRAEQKIT